MLYILSGTTSGGLGSILVSLPSSILIKIYIFDVLIHPNFLGNHTAGDIVFKSSVSYHWLFSTNLLLTNLQLIF